MNRSIRGSLICPIAIRMLRGARITPAASHKVWTVVLATRLSHRGIICHWPLAVGLSCVRSIPHQSCPQLSHNIWTVVIAKYRQNTEYGRAVLLIGSRSPTRDRVLLRDCASPLLPIVMLKLGGPYYPSRPPTRGHVLLRDYVPPLLPTVNTTAINTQ